MQVEVKSLRLFGCSHPGNRAWPDRHDCFRHGCWLPERQKLPLYGTVLPGSHAIPSCLLVRKDNDTIHGLMFKRPSPPSAPRSYSKGVDLPERRRNGRQAVRCQQPGFRWNREQHLLSLLMPAFSSCLSVAPAIPEEGGDKDLPKSSAGTLPAINYYWYQKLRFRHALAGKDNTNLGASQ